MNQRKPARGRQNQLFNPNQIHPNPKHVLQLNVGNDQIHHQKLSCSQLIHFLKTSRKPASELPSSADEVKYRPNITQSSFGLMQQQNISATASVNQRVVALTGAERNRENKIFSKENASEPMFAEKESADVSYHWMIATNTEVWDIGDISSDTDQSLPEPFPNEVTDFNFQADCKVPDLWSRSVCPSAEEPWRLKDGQSPDTLTDHTEDDHAVHVTITEFQSRRFEEMPVVISHAVNPNNFFIQHKDTHLCELSESMLRNSSRSFAEMNRIPDVGVYVMVWFLKQEMWSRGQIIRICQMSRGSSSRDCTDIKVEVRRIDYGDVVCVSLWDVKELCGEAASIPVQALQVSLVNVRPVNGETWSFEAISWFKSKVQNKTLYARLYPEEGEVLVELFMEKGKIGAMRRGDSLSVRLAQNRFAVHECNKPRGLKRSDVPEQTRQQSLQREKYLISCYSHNRE
ncbi:uncharacterized protein LOC107724541 isoform X2 [Sinocyclocheilus rhinocerous]|uniref:uncharacterized protein LOC107724541 isoform X2 n=1 Tax=Sinocyclocheilus rhinocerous TaxID=307959 RepID=UPI0007BABC4E|nr:PREDICTED: uncharacterized protein LOC107724541 isoform X2 [Sinocyclocheilus rhinocerous]